MAEVNPNEPGKSSFGQMKDFGLRDAQKTQTEQPRWENKPPDIKMMAGPPGPEEQSAQDLLVEAAKRSASGFGRERSPYAENLLAAERPSQMYEALRSILRVHESPHVASALKDSYSLTRLGTELFLRKQTLATTVTDLTTGLHPRVTRYNPSTGEGVPLTSNDASYAIATREREIWIDSGRWQDEKGDWHPEQEKRIVPAYFFEIPPEKGEKMGGREKLRIACERLINEFSYKVIAGEILGTIDLNRDALAPLVTWMFQRNSKFQIPQLKEIYNLPAIDKVDQDPYDKSYGKQIEQATWFYMAMMRSHTKTSMVDFLDRPATDAIAESLGLTKEQLVRTYIGDVEKWDEDISADGKTSRIISGGSATHYKEANDGRRGLITRFGNIPAVGGVTYEDEESLVQTIADAVGSKDAAWLAAVILKVEGVFADEGVVLLRNPKASDPQLRVQVALALGEDIFFSGDDRGKFHAAAYTEKEKKTGRVFGPKGLIGKIPDMGQSFKRTMIVDKAVAVGETAPPDVILKRGRQIIERNVMDAWLGFKEGKVKDPISGEEIDCPAEPYVPLGELNYGSLKRGIWAAQTQLWWLAGRDEPTKAPFEFLTDVAPRPDSFFEDGLRKRRKFTTIVYNPLNALGGNFRGIKPERRGEISKEMSAQVMADWFDAVRDLPAYRFTAGQEISFVEGKTGKKVPSTQGVMMNAIGRLLGFHRDRKFDPEKQWLPEEEFRGNAYFSNEELDKELKK